MAVESGFPVPVVGVRWSRVFVKHDELSVVVLRDLVQWDRELLGCAEDAGRVALAYLAPVFVVSLGAWDDVVGDLSGLSVEFPVGWCSDFVDRAVCEVLNSSEIPTPVWAPHVKAEGSQAFAGLLKVACELLGLLDFLRAYVLGELECAFLDSNSFALGNGAALWAEWLGLEVCEANGKLVVPLALDEVGGFF